MGQAELIAGGLAGVSQVVIGQPLDTVKVRLQTQSLIYKSTGCIFILKT